MRKRRIEGSVVVVTGASSGIGRAAARRFAERGASLVLAARREAPLRELAAECSALGGRAVAVPTDVTDESAVEALARRADEEFGRLDVWVNNAAVHLFGRFEDSPLHAYRRVVETNVFGYVHGARAALPRFRRQRSGVLINVGSVNSVIGSPYASAYVASKFAVRGLGECLRQELLDEPDIHVCTVLPASIDTPLFQHAANYTGRAIKPLSPVVSVGRVADAIVRSAEQPKRERVVGGAGRFVVLARTLAPAVQERVMARLVERDHFQDVAADPSDGNLFAPMPAWTSASGGWRARRTRSLRLAVAAAGAVVPSLLVASRLRR